MDLNFIYRRHSVRNFKPTMVPKQHIQEIIKAATAAPSGKNKQNWHFVVITDPEKIAEIAGIVEKKHQQLLSYLQNEDRKQAFKGSAKYHTVFNGAPTLVLVYAGPYDTIADALLADGLMSSEQALAYARPNPGIQNIAAAMENLHLAAAAMGYGTCWMTGPTYAAEEISRFIGFAKESYYLAALTPLGIPATDKLTSPPRKPLEEILTFID